MATTTRVCAGIGCANEAPATERDATNLGETRRGWIELRVDAERHRFCSWDCLASFANHRLSEIAGD